MATEMPADVDAGLRPLAWLIGHWEGGGHGRWPDGADFAYAATIDFTHIGRPWLHYYMQLFETDEAGTPLRPLVLEDGFWRPQPDNGVEVVVAQPEGVAEVYYGRVQGAQIELTTDAVVRTQTATVATTGSHRLYGEVEHDLLFAWDRGTATTEIQPYLWARLGRRR